MVNKKIDETEEEKKGRIKYTEQGLPTLDHNLRGIFSRYESMLEEYGIPQKVRHELAEKTIRQVFYCGATNELNDLQLKYKDIESKKEEERKIDKKIDAFEKILKEYLIKS